jgi:hypothetical protein
MNVLVRPSACPHDCPSTCALELLPAHTIGRDPTAPYAGAAFHDNKVWLHKARAAD